MRKIEKGINFKSIAFYNTGYVVLESYKEIEHRNLQNKVYEKANYFLSVLDQYTLEEIENAIPNKNETNNHKN